MKRSIRQLIGIATAAALLAGGVVLRAQTEGDPEEFTAFAINMGSLTGTGGTAQLIININRWTAASDRDEMFAILRKQGQNGLLEHLRNARSVGTLRTPNSIGYDLRLALAEPGKDGGRRVLVVTDRPVGFGEAVNRPPSIDYPFTVIDMNIPAEGYGKGTMSIAAKIIPAGRTVLIENYDTQPVQLNRIENRKRTKR